MQERFAPDFLEIVDESEDHLGHPEAEAGSHYKVTITSSAFTGITLLERHRMIHTAIGNLEHHQIHALSIVAFAPAEADYRTASSVNK